MRRAAHAIVGTVPTQLRAARELGRRWAIEAKTIHRLLEVDPKSGGFPDLSPPETQSDFYFVQAEDPEPRLAALLNWSRRGSPRRFGLHPIRDIQMLCPMNRGGVGARSLNIELQAALNPAAHSSNRR